MIFHVHKCFICLNWYLLPMYLWSLSLLELIPLQESKGLLCVLLISTWNSACLQIEKLSLLLSKFLLHAVFFQFFDWLSMNLFKCISMMYMVTFCFLIYSARVFSLVNWNYLHLMLQLICIDLSLSCFLVIDIPSLSRLFNYFPCLADPFS